MSRFARLQAEPVRTWAPAESPLRIEYESALLRDVRMSGTGVDAFGVLYGARQGSTIRLAATRGRAGLQPVGVFASRVRGKVFLTEEDLERFDRADASVALVISGEKGGFFVRDTTGSIETVRSYEEFRLNPQPVTVVKPRRWSWAFSFLLPLLYFVPHHAPPALAVTLREDAGQLRISWNVRKQATLTILDGGERTSISITPEQSTVTYARRTGDVLVGIGAAEARFVGPALPPAEIDIERASVRKLKSKIAALRAVHAERETKIAALQRRLQ